MNVILHSTTKVVTLNGVEARIWQGFTETGIPVHAYITRIAHDRDEPNHQQFVEELKECIPPTMDLSAIPLRLLI